LPKLESGIHTKQDLGDGEGYFRKIADRLAVIFDANLQQSTPFGGCRSRHHEKNQRQSRRTDAGY
jgi:hypothetical protein